MTKLIFFLFSVGQDSCQVPVRKSCKEILDHGEVNGDGEYPIKPDGANEQVVYCDMSTNGGKKRCTVYSCNL